MNRLLVSLLAALDAVLAAAGGLAIALAPLTLLWVFGLGGGADWAALWPASAVLWQLGHLVPVTVTLPDAYLAVTGIDASAAVFAISLAPLAFAAFTAIFAARSGGRAALAGAPVTGPVTGILVFGGVATVVAVTGTTEIAAVERWQAIVLPLAIFAVPCAVGALTGAWRHRVAPLARLRERVETLPGGWAAVPGLVVRGAAVSWAGLVGVGALMLAVAVLLRGGQVVALFQAGNVDAIGATVLALGQLAYLPTLVVWALSFAAGPGFSLGAGSAVSPSGTQTGVVPGIPALGLVPDSTSPWLLLLILLPVAVGVLTGWVLRSRLARETPAGLDDVGPRLVVLAGVTVLSGAFAALAAACAAGSIGPGVLARVGPEPGPVALAVGLEIALGAGILLLAPRGANDDMPEHSVAAASLATSSSAGSDRPLAFPDLAPEARTFGPGAGFTVPDARVWADAARADEADGAARATPDAGSAADRADSPEAGVASAPGESPTEPILGIPRADHEERPDGGDADRPDEQITEPIARFERGTTGKSTAEDEPGSSVD